MTITNPIGHLVEAETDTCSGQSSGMITDEWFSYSARGELTDLYQSTPHSGGYYHSTASYYPNGALQNLSPGIGGGQLTLPWTYGVDSEGRTILNQNTKYNVASQLTNVVSSTGDNDVYTYDPNTGRMTQYQSNIGTAPTQITGALQWNPNGTLQKLTTTDGFTPSTSQTCLYSYDDLARLGSVNCTNPSSQNVWNQNFSYDAYGNVTKIIPTGGTGIAWNPGYTATNQYASGSGAQYDADGNLLNDTFNQYTWNSDGKVASIKPLPSGNTTTSTYDALGREVEFGVTTFTQVMYAPTGKIALMNGQTEINAFQPLLGGGVLVHRPGSLTNYWRHGDWLGSSRLASTTPGRTKFFDTAYAPFGENYLSAGTTDLDFTGQNQDTSTNSGGLYDFPFREYSPRQGRWISPDPAGIGASSPLYPQSWNRYAYVLNNPLGYTDPLGLYCYYGSLEDEEKNNNPSDYDFTSDGPGECQSTGGLWRDTSVTVTVNGDNPDDVGLTMMGGREIFPEVVPLGQSYTDCIKNAGNYFSLQHGLQAVSGGELGNSWLSGALLGNPVSDAVETGQSVFNRDVSGVIDKGGSVAVALADPAGKTLEAATQLQDVTLVTASVAVTAVRIPGASVTSISMNSAIKTIPLGLIGTMAKPLLSLARGLNVWNYGVSAVAAGVLCPIGR